MSWDMSANYHTDDGFLQELVCALTTGLMLTQINMPAWMEPEPFAEFVLDRAIAIREQYKLRVAELHAQEVAAKRAAAEKEKQ
jgi:hypothetical protein